MKKEKRYTSTPISALQGLLQGEFYRVTLLHSSEDTEENQKIFGQDRQQPRRWISFENIRRRQSWKSKQVLCTC